MRRRGFIALLASATAAIPYRAGAVAAPCSPGAEACRAKNCIAERLVGAWRFVSSVSTREDGSTFNRWGPNSKGTFMFDAAGHFSQIIMGSESRLFGAKTYFAFGTYSVDESKKIIATQIEGSSVSRLNGTAQQRVITELTADELKYTNFNPSSGAKLDAVWKRMT
jgi:hypothetical protein